MIQEKIKKAFEYIIKDYFRLTGAFVLGMTTAFATACLIKFIF